MSIRQLSLTDFRNLRSTTLELHPDLNLVVGDNGSGKTSFLEAVHVLCQAQSFRTHQLKQCIQHGKDSFLLFGRFTDFKAGLSKSGKKLTIHVDGEPVQRRSDLVRKVPISIINADTFELLDGAPAKRRAFLDWCLFHVKPTYADAWARARHALKQRNQLLRSGQDLKLLDYWDEHLVEPSMEIHRMREELCAEIGETLRSDLSDLLEAIPIELNFVRGWSGAETLAAALRQQRQRDIRSGFTQSGIHRDDLQLKSRGAEARHQLSRGESKRLCIGLLLTVLKQVNTNTGKAIILLVDDLNSELDARAQRLVYEHLSGLDLQLVISNIDATIPAPLEGKDFKWFHVEHGTIKPRNFS